MISRGTLVVALIALECAVVAEAVIAVRGGGPAAPAGLLTSGQIASGSRLIEGGAHKFFDPGAHPALAVDIGHADLTILTSRTAQIDVSVSPSTDFGVFREKSPITARADGGTVRIAAAERRSWTMGDDRMVTVVVPPETQVTVLKAGDIKADGLRADASFNSVGSGTITLEDFAAPTVHAESSDGRILLHRIVAERLEATSESGRVEGSGLQVRDGSVETGARVTLGFAAGADTRVTAETSNGTVSLSGFASAEPSAGDRSAADDGADHPSSQTVRIGAGDGHLTVHSSDGDITLAQEG